MSFTRRLATLTALGLASAGLVAVAAQPATAAGESLDWRISQQFTDHLSSRAVTGGASEDADGVFSFPVASSDIGDDGAGSVTYDGSVAGSFAMVGTTYYTVTIADPTVTVDADGEGEITALVSAWNAAGMGSPEQSTDPARVVVTTFDADGGWDDGMITATPDWDGVLPEGEESAELGIGEGKPVEGKSFAPAYLGQLTSGVRAHFYASGSGSDPKKAPADFTAAAGAGGATPTVETSTSYAGRSVEISVEGSGFTAVTEPGDQGVYVALAPAGKFPETDDFEDQEKVADAEWVTPAQMADGTFAVTLDPANAHLVPGTKYAVHTWQAHGHSNPSQDTTTPVAINWKKVGAATKVKVAKAGKALKVTVVGGKAAAGKVAVKLTQGKATKTAKAPLKKGKVAVKLPKLGKGRWKAVVSYAPSTADYRSAKTKITFRVR